MNYIRRPSWTIPESQVTPEHVFLNRRAFLAGTAGLATAAALPATGAAAIPEEPFAPKPPPHPGYIDAGRPVTAEALTSKYNNFYEFGSYKQISEPAQALSTDGWTIAVDGLVDKPFEIGADELIAKMPVQERIYRHRCVEAWSMVAPWIGFPLADLVQLAAPTADAKFIRFETFLDPGVARGQKQFWYPWPYVEGVTMAEAMNELSFMVVGAYGKVLHKQFGAPMRLHLPWKYGFKSIKSIRKISFVAERPVGFWEELQYSEYGFWANVNPEVDHPRWSQATEQVLGVDERVPTQLFNGYAEQVAGLYAGLEATEGDRVWR